MKQKFYLWLNIVFICLCLCAIGVGIYSLSAKSINSTGKVAFSAHDISVEVTGTIVGHAQGNVSTGVPTTEPETLTPATFENGIGTMDLGNRYFSNCPDSGDPSEDILVNLTVKNTSNYKITATIGNHTTPFNISVTESSLLADLEPNETWDVTLTLSITDYTTAIPQGTNNVILGMDFAYYYNPYYISEYAGKSWLTTQMGYSTEYDGRTDIPIEWVAFAVKGEDLTTTHDAYSIEVESGSSAGTWYSLNGTVDWASYNLDTDLQGKTFWFISKYSICGGYEDAEGNDLTSGEKYQGINSNTDIGYVDSNIFFYLQHDFIKDTKLNEKNSHARVTNRVVDDKASTINDEDFRACSFTANFWLLNVYELFLLHGGVVPHDVSSNDELGEPLQSYGIGNMSTFAYAWALRALMEDYKSLVAVLNQGYIPMIFGIVNFLIGTRPACEITID